MSIGCPSYGVTLDTNSIAWSTSIWDGTFGNHLENTSWQCARKPSTHIGSLEHGSNSYEIPWMSMAKTCSFFLKYFFYMCNIRGRCLRVRFLPLTWKGLLLEGCYKPLHIISTSDPRIPNIHSCHSSRISYQLLVQTSKSEMVCLPSNTLRTSNNWHSIELDSLLHKNTFQGSILMIDNPNLWCKLWQHYIMGWL